MNNKKKLFNGLKSPIKISFKTEILPILLIIISITSSFYFLQQMPDKIPTHWNFKGKINPTTPIIKATLAIFEPITFAEIISVKLEKNGRNKMAQRLSQRVVNTFIKGLVTEAGELTFPEDASIDESNCLLERDLDLN
jgi:uncharacterized membrane protein